MSFGFYYDRLFFFFQQCTLSRSMDHDSNPFALHLVLLLVPCSECIVFDVGFVRVWAFLIVRLAM